MLTIHRKQCCQVAILEVECAYISMRALMIENVLTDEARVAVLRALYALILDDEAPASARVAAARLFLSQYDEQKDDEQSAIVIVDDETSQKTL